MMGPATAWRCTYSCIHSTSDHPSVAREVALPCVYPGPRLLQNKTTQVSSNLCIVPSMTQQHGRSLYTARMQTMVWNNSADDGALNRHTSIHYKCNIKSNTRARRSLQGILNQWQQTHCQKYEVSLTTVLARPRADLASQREYSV